MTKTTLVSFLVALLITFAFPAVYASSESVGSVETVFGKVTLKHDERGKRQAEAKSDVFLRDMVKTTHESRVVIVFQDGSRIHVGPKTKLVITEYLYQPKKPSKVLLDLLEGQIRLWSNRALTKGTHEIRTKNATAGLRGTTIEIVYWKQIKFTMVAVLEGAAEVEGKYKPETKTLTKPNECVWIVEKREASEAQPMSTAPKFFRLIGEGAEPPREALTRVPHTLDDVDLY